MELLLFKPEEWSFTGNALELVTTNPFDPDWSKEGRRLLGLPFPDDPEAIAWRPGARLWGPHSVYSEKLHKQITEMGERLQQRLQEGSFASKEELGRYELLSLYRLYCQYGEKIDRFIDTAVRSYDKKSDEVHSFQDEEAQHVVKTMWEGFDLDYEKMFDFTHLTFRRKYEPQHIFACFFLFRRAFYHIFFNIVGTSKPIVQLRKTAWESIVTHDLLAWVQGLYKRMRDIPTLITGPSGTGKERVAEAIGRSLYIPFDPKKDIRDRLSHVVQADQFVGTPSLVD